MSNPVTQRVFKFIQHWYCLGYFTTRREANLKRSTIYFTYALFIQALPVRFILPVYRLRESLTFRFALLLNTHPSSHQLKQKLDTVLFKLMLFLYRPVQVGWFHSHCPAVLRDWAWEVHYSHFIWRSIHKKIGFEEVSLISSKFNPYNYNNNKTQGHKILNMKSFSHWRRSTTIITSKKLTRTCICKCFTFSTVYTTYPQKICNFH